MRRKDVWPFSDPKNLACITAIDVLDGRKPIGLVTHDVDDGSWQFLPFDGVGDDDDTGSTRRVISLEETTKIEPCILELADLPVGWIAYRESIAKGWTREPNDQR